MHREKKRQHLRKKERKGNEPLLADYNPDKKTKQKFYSLGWGRKC